MRLVMNSHKEGSSLPKNNIGHKVNFIKNLCPLSSLVLAVVFILVVCHSVGLFFIYTKIHKLESLEPIYMDSFSTNLIQFENHFESKTRELIQKEFSKLLKHSETSSEPLEKVLNARKVDKEIINNYKNHKESVPKDSILEQTPEGPVRTKREIPHHRRRYRSEQNDELSVQLQGQENMEGADKSWLQLTSYARIPYNAIQEFCSKTRASCPPGPMGPKGPLGETGPHGQIGERGDRGLPGLQGPRGPTGLPGIPGPPGQNGRKGDIGPSGIPGLDGRDGLPGEPGLDGIPGRNGLDGIPGVDGIPGFDGLPGKDGRNGTDGRPGLKGSKGDQGPVGPRGIAGPRGRMGKNGTPGTAGIPGIQTWHVNGTVPEKLLIPPSIPGTKHKRKPIIVREKDNLRLRCQAAGEPPPRIEWSREDGMAIATGQWKDGSLISSTLNLTHIRRDHAGAYRCEAYNGILPNDFKTFEVEVHFDPFVKVNNWKVGTFNGSSATLECHVEAFPIAVTYWEDRRGRILENSTKYRVLLRQDNSYIWKSSMFLQIFEITKEDFGDYHCVAKNILSMTRGLVKVHEIDPNRYVPSTGTADGLTFGPEPPNYSELFNDLCPPPVECPTCPKTTKRPQSRGSLYCLRVQQFGNDTYPGFKKNRTLDCELNAVGKPVYHRHTESDFGSWMRDPLPREPKEETKYWTTTPDDPYRLFEYIDKVHYRKDHHTRNYTLPVPFEGNSHVVYNGSFFYHPRGEKEIIKYDILHGVTKALPIPQLSLNESSYLYNGGKDFVDLITDENGLWAIYGLPESNNTVVMKIDPWTFKAEYSWNISLSHHKFGEMFITCGVLYGIDSSVKRDTKIRFALDLYKKNILDVDLPFTNPFKKTTMLGYNPLTKEIYSWDAGNQLTYPIKYIDIGYNTPLEDNDAKSKTTFNDYEADYEVRDFHDG